MFTAILDKLIGRSERATDDGQPTAMSVALQALAAPTAEGGDTVSSPEQQLSPAAH